MLCQGGQLGHRRGREGRVNTPGLSDPKEILAPLTVVQHLL